MVMESTRLTGSSTSMTSVSSRRPRSTGVAASGEANQAAAKARLGSSSSRCSGATSAATPAWSRSKKRAA